MRDIDILDKYARDALKEKIEYLILDLQRELNLMEKQGECYLPNTLGILQLRGQQVDLLCSEIGAYWKLKGDK